MKKINVRIFILALFLILNITRKAFSYETVTVNHKGEAQEVRYDLYVPPVTPVKPMAVLVCVGGLPIIDGQYVHSDPTECRSENWEKFANENNVAILGVGFLFNQKDWDKQASYQYAKVWSAKALNLILDNVSKNNPIDKKQLYLFGISAGAQFSLRYAFTHPQRAKAVAAHAAGGYDKPKNNIKTKFLITVGSLDNNNPSRVDWARFFMENARQKGIDVQAVLFPGIAHEQTEAQNEMSRQFFKEVLQKNL